MRTARPLIASVAVLLVAYAGDLEIGGELRHAITAFGPDSALFGVATARLVAVVLVLLVARTVFDGPRHRLIGAAMLAIGLFFAYWPSLSSAGVPVAAGMLGDAYAVDISTALGEATLTRHAQAREAAPRARAGGPVPPPAPRVLSAPGPALRWARAVQLHAAAPATIGEA